MVRRSFALWTLVLLIPLCGLLGCVSSVHPLHESKNLHFEAGLLGVWSGNGETLTIQESGKSSYMVAIEKDAQKSVYLAHLTQLGGAVLADLYQEDDALERMVGGQYFPLLVRVHLFCRIQLEGDILRIAPLDADWMEAEIEDIKATLPHERTEDGLLLTASTRQLREFFLQRSERFDQAFSDASQWRRRPTQR